MSIEESAADGWKVCPRCTGTGRIRAKAGRPPGSKDKAPRSNGRWNGKPVKATAPPRKSTDRQVVYAFWAEHGQPTLRVIGQHFGFTSERARQILCKFPEYNGQAGQQRAGERRRLATRKKLVAWLAANPGCRLSDAWRATRASFTVLREAGASIGHAFDESYRPKGRMATVLALHLAGKTRPEIAEELQIKECIVCSSITRLQRYIPDLPPPVDARKTGTRRTRSIPGRAEVYAVERAKRHQRLATRQAARREKVWAVIEAPAGPRRRGRRRRRRR